MSTHTFKESEQAVKESSETNITEESPSTRLSRRRKIEDLFEEKRMKEELAEFL